MYGKLRMSAIEAHRELRIICSRVYLEVLSPEERSDRLKKCLEKLLVKKGLPKDLKFEQDARVAEEGYPW